MDVHLVYQMAWALQHSWTTAALRWIAVFWATIVVDEVSKPPYSVELQSRLRSAALVPSKIRHNRDRHSGRPHDHRQCNWQQSLTPIIAVTLAVEA
jgi:hypothetical protein